jgi:hypothetical protein
MPNNNIPFEDFIHQWSKFEIFVNSMLVVSFTTIGLVFIIALLGFKGGLILPAGLLLSIPFVALIVSRNRILRRIVMNKTNREYYSFLEKFWIRFFFLFSMIVYFIFVVVSRMSLDYLLVGFLSSVGLAGLFFPFFLLFFNSISRTGEIHALFSFLFTNLNDYRRRQE